MIKNNKSNSSNNKSKSKKKSGNIQSKKSKLTQMFEDELNYSMKKFGKKRGARQKDLGFICHTDKKSVDIFYVISSAVDRSISVFICD